MKNRNLLSLLLVAVSGAVCGGIISLFTFAQIFENRVVDKIYQQAGSLSPLPNPYFQHASFEPFAINDVSFPDLTYAAEKAVNCVVHVRVKTMQEVRNPFAELFGHGQRQQVPQEGFGSGVIISADGFIVTNNHVISRSDEIEVALNDGRVFEAKVIGADPSTDLALLKIEEVNLPYLVFGDSQALRVGEWVLAVGNPLNLPQR